MNLITDDQSVWKPSNGYRRRDFRLAALRIRRADEDGSCGCGRGASRVGVGLEEGGGLQTDE